MVWMTKEAAAQHLGVHVATIDRKLKRGELNGRQEPRPRGWRWLVELPDNLTSTEVPTLPTHSPKDAPTNANAKAPTDAHTNPVANDAALLWELINTLREEVSLLKHQLEVHEQELEHRAQEMQRMQVLLQQALDPTRAIAPPRQRSWWRRWWGKGN
jgi:hypothetical protein